VGGVSHRGRSVAARGAGAGGSPCGVADDVSGGGRRAAAAGGRGDGFRPRAARCDGVERGAVAGAAGGGGVAALRSGGGAAAAGEPVDGQRAWGGARAGDAAGHPSHRGGFLVARGVHARARGALPRGGRRRRGASQPSGQDVRRACAAGTGGAARRRRGGALLVAGAAGRGADPGGAHRPAAAAGADACRGQPGGAAAAGPRRGAPRAEPGPARHAVHDHGRGVPRVPRPPHRAGRRGDRLAAGRTVAAGLRGHAGLLRQSGGVARRSGGRSVVRRAGGAYPVAGARLLRARRLSAGAPR